MKAITKMARVKVDERFKHGKPIRERFIFRTRVVLDDKMNVSFWFGNHCKAVILCLSKKKARFAFWNCTADGFLA